MFTGIVECMGKVESISSTGTNLDFWISSPISNELKIDQSIAHQGVCLTVVELKDGMHRVTAVKETLDKTDLKGWKQGSFVNLERCMPANGRFDGHVVQGHVDCIAICTSVEDLDGSWKYRFNYEAGEGRITVSKGSICINGTSLTVVDSGEDFFTVVIIPYTFNHTTIQFVEKNTFVNIEFDVFGKYVAKLTRKLG